MLLFPKVNHVQDLRNWHTYFLVKESTLKGQTMRRDTGSQARSHSLTCAAVTQT
ncbi:hypothetical protein LC593_02055 [Nostoc sp. CHAB 5844]|nr:hypothetical protein [Nostoc sp. CHAB 5844]